MEVFRKNRRPKKYSARREDAWQLQIPEEGVENRVTTCK
jgi:hypothetical protein